MKKLDAIVIGSGQGGTPLAKKLARAGLKTALIEKKYFGGTCVNNGCTPTKALIACARQAYNMTRSREFGIEAKAVTVNFKKVMARKDKIVQRFRQGTEKGLKETQGLTCIHGEAAFIDHKKLSVTRNDGSNEILTAGKIFINTGLQTRIPDDIEGLDKSPYFTSTTLLDAKELPSHLVILGGSYIGLEFGQMFRRFGSEVTIIESAAQLLPSEDEDISRMVKEMLEEEGIRVWTNSRVNKITADGNIKINDGPQNIAGTAMLLAAGRIPGTKTLHLAKTGVETNDEGYIKVNEHLETNVPGIYALGDIKGGPAFTHIAYNDYIILSKNLLENAALSTTGRQIPYCMFTDPQLGRIGITEKQAQDKGYDIEIARLPMKKAARGIETGNTRGMMKAVTDKRSGKILGGAILASQGGEIMSVLQMAMLGGFTARQIRYQVFAHPLYAESLNNLFMTLEQNRG